MACSGGGVNNHALASDARVIHSQAAPPRNRVGVGAVPCSGEPESVLVVTVGKHKAQNESLRGCRLNPCFTS
jgi:hypothetical protein